MDDITDQHPNESSGSTKIGNNRKRRLSAVELDESLKKRMTESSILTGVVKNENRKKDNENNAQNKDDPSTNAFDIYGEYHNKFPLEELCDEVLYEIVKFLNTWSLMALMNVSKRFQKFVLDKRLWKNIDLSQEPLPLGILEDMLERSHDKTTTIKLRGPSPSHHIEGEIKHFNQTIHKSLTTRCINLVTLELYSITLDFNQATFKDFPQTLKRLVFNNCNVRVDSNIALFNGVDKILVNLEELAIENNSWFDPFYVMSLSKLPALRNLSLKGCWQMQEFLPYGSIAARHGFKKLEVLDLRDTPLNDSDLQCFNAVETLKEIYLQCTAEYSNTQLSSDSTTATQSATTNNNSKSLIHNCTLNSESDNKPSTSTVFVADSNSSSKNLLIAPVPIRRLSISDSESNTSVLTENPSTSSLSSTTSSKDNDTKTVEDPLFNTALTLNDNDSSSDSSSSSSSPSCSQSPKKSASNNENNIENSPMTSSASTGFGLSPNIVPLVGTNAPTRSGFLARPDHIFYLDVRNRTLPNAVHVNVHEYNNRRQVRMVNRSLQNQQSQQNQQSPPPVIEQMMRHNLFWDIVNPLGRVFGGGSDRLFVEENNAEYHLNLFPLSSPSRQQYRGAISDRGVCCFGRTRQPVQHGVIWIRFNNRPRENRFERFSVRDYKFVTDVSLQHLVQCSPHLVFLDVSGTSVTLDGLKRFKELKPECKVVAEHLTGLLEK